MQGADAHRRNDCSISKCGFIHSGHLWFLSLSHLQQEKPASPLPAHAPPPQHAKKNILDYRCLLQIYQHTLQWSQKQNKSNFVLILHMLTC